MSLRESLEDGYDTIDAETPDPVAPEPASTPEVEAPPEQPTEPTPTPGERDAQGRFVPQPAAKPTKPAARAQPVPASGVQARAAAGPAGAAPGGVAAPAVPGSAPPQSLKPAARELWGRLPPEFDALKSDWARREKETTAALARAAEATRTGGAFAEQMRPYEATIRASGMEPVAYVGSLLQTVHALTYGPPQTQADTLAAVVAQYGAHLLQPDRQEVDGSFTSPLVRALGARLGGQGAPQGAPYQPAQQAQFRDPRLDQLLAEQASRVEQSAQDRSETFRSGHEFGADVADAVADILEVWARQGKREVTEAELEKAYVAACWSNPEIAAILEQRRAVQSVGTVQAGTQRARAAASSIRTQPTSGAPAKPAGIRAALLERYDEIDSQ